MRIVFVNATVVNTDTTLSDCTVVVEHGKFERVEPGGPIPGGPDTATFDAGDWLLFPGLINIHDHLRGSWLPRCGNGPYENVYQWLRELHAKPSVFAPARERDRIDGHRLYWLGTYKNLFSGVTTVVDHYVRLDSSFYQLPIRLITEFGREGVVRSHREPQLWPSWGEGIVEEFRKCRGISPFIIHVEEGVDEETGTELRRLEQLGVLAQNTILIHGIGFDEEDIALVAQCGCHMVWCPATHEFLYRRTGNVARWLELGINTSLGTDSSLTGGLNLLDEMRTAQRCYSQTFGQSLRLEVLFGMVTSNPARALGMGDTIGRVERGFAADLLVLERDTDRAPLETLLQAEPKDIVLLLQDGQPRFGDERFQWLFESDPQSIGSSPVIVGGRAKWVVGDPVGLLRAVQGDIGRRYRPAFLPFDDSELN
ncbi:amidohydrolase family protein [Candidatus Sumerlaeota bacterium]|nr:amidohydrolase family protein [Candidatus Sumerlaeota bacterium]